MTMYRILLALLLLATPALAQAAAAQTPPAVQTSPNMVASAAPSPDQQQLKAMSLGIAAMRRSVDQLQNEITKLRAAQQEILDKISMLRRGRPLPRRTTPRQTPSSQQAVRLGPQPSRQPQSSQAPQQQSCPVSGAGFC
jgi:hypothetical protein